MQNDKHEYVIAYRDELTDPLLQRRTYVARCAQDALENFLEHNPDVMWHTVLQLVPVLENPDG